MASSKVLFVSIIASSTIDPLAAPPKDPFVVVVSAGETHKNRHFRHYFQRKLGAEIVMD